MVGVGLRLGLNVLTHIDLLTDLIAAYVRTALISRLKCENWTRTRLCSLKELEQINMLLYSVDSDWARVSFQGWH